MFISFDSKHDQYNRCRQYKYDQRDKRRVFKQYADVDLGFLVIGNGELVLRVGDRTGRLGVSPTASLGCYGVAVVGVFKRKAVGIALAGIVGLNDLVGNAVGQVLKGNGLIMGERQRGACRPFAVGFCLVGSGDRFLGAVGVGHVAPHRTRRRVACVGKGHGCRVFLGQIAHVAGDGLFY